MLAHQPSRRGFLGALLGGLAASAVIDPEKLLWVPGRKTISIPSPVRLSMLDEINAVTMRYLASAPKLIDNIFQQDPLLYRLVNSRYDLLTGGVTIQDYMSYSS